MHKITNKFLIIYLIVVIILTIVALECAVRFLHLAPSLPPRYTEFVKEECLPFRARPNSITINRPWPASKEREFQFEFKTNSLGFRDIERSFTKPQGVFRILALGDSFTAGAGSRYEGTYPYQLEGLFKRRTGNHPRVEVINFGQCRYWPEPERILFETLGIKFKPDLILLGFNLGDISDTYVGINYSQVRQGYLVTREAYELGDIGVWFYVHSHLFRKLAKIYLYHRLKNSARGSESDLLMQGISLPKSCHEKDWLQIESEYGKILKIARRNNAKLAIVYFPLKPDEISYPLERLMNWGRKHNVLVIDPIFALIEAAKGEKVYWEKDVHCTEAGYRVIAETVYSKLIEAQIAP